MTFTRHFTLAEATKSDTARKLGLSNQPDAADLQRITDTAYNMELVRAVLGNNPILVNSWYRNEQVNRAVGGVSNSAHRLGYAVDFSCPKFGSITDACKAIESSELEFDQLIWEYGRWVHISFDPRARRQVLHTNGDGYRLGIP